MSGEQVDSQFKTLLDSQLYNFCYDIVATMDLINNSEYVVTKHSTCSVTKKKIGKGIIQRRIKIKHTKPTVSPKATGTGTKHRYKYRVRGHWREMEDGKRTWIKDHVRGGDGTIFIPKEYDV